MIKIIRPVKWTRGVDRRLTQLFGVNRSSYAKFWLAGHNWLDYAWPNPWDKINIYSPIDGKIKIKQYDPQWYGHYLVIEWLCDDNKTICEVTLGHFSDILDSIHVGDNINATSLLGVMWSSWNSTWVHLHMWIRYKLNWTILNYNNGFKWAVDFSKEVSDWPKSEIDSLVELWITNWSDLKWNAKREDVMIMLYRMYNLIMKTKK